MDILTLIFAVVAIVIFFKLKNVLGTRNGNEKPPRSWPSPQPKKTADIVTLKPQPQIASAKVQNSSTAASSPLASELQFIRDADPAFSAEKFLVGAKVAYEMVTEAAAKGDRMTLGKLLGQDLYADFEDDIAAREANGETLDHHFIGFDKAEIVEAALKDRLAEITVAFSAKIVQAKRNKAGDVIAGDGEAASDVTDRWVFTRSTASRDPNWQLVAIEAD